MNGDIIVALIGLAGSAAGSLCGILVSGKLTQFRIEQLEKKVEKHNSLIERMYALEEKHTVQEEKLRETDRRVGQLEKTVKA